ncbi:hypothetical protein ACLB2K_064122 [Fragaria x ananassa]
MSGLNVKIDKFTGRNSFSLWQIKMRALLKQQGMWAPLVKKSGDPEIAEMASLEEKAHSTILLCLADDIITEVAEEETAAGLWLKLESLYMTKSLTNKLLLKRRLFSLRMKGDWNPEDDVDGVEEGERGGRDFKGAENIMPVAQIGSSLMMDLSSSTWVTVQSLHAITKPLVLSD